MDTRLRLVTHDTNKDLGVGVIKLYHGNGYANIRWENGREGDFNIERIRPHVVRSRWTKNRHFTRLEEYRMRQLDEYSVDYLYHMTMIENLPSILRHGILSHSDVERNKIATRDISDPEVQARRKGMSVYVEKGMQENLHCMVSLYFEPRNPMLYKRIEIQGQICIVLVDSCYAIREVEGECGGPVRFAFSDGNLASPVSRSYYRVLHLNKLPWDVLRANYWNDHEDGKRKRCAEFLSTHPVGSEGFSGVVVNSNAAKDRVGRMLDGHGVKCMVCPDFFF
jgi:hypothetical protein